MKKANLLKDPLAAMELAEKTLESDPTSVQANTLLKDAAKAAGYPEVATFALETIVGANPNDTKLLHELGEHYLSMGHADRAVDIYSKIASINPADLIAVKRSKDAAATASMKSGGWDEVAASGGKKDYRDLIKNKEEAVSLEQKGRVFKDVDMLDAQLAELYPEWEANQQNVDLSRRIAKLYEDKYELVPDADTLNSALWYYTHTNSLLSGSDPAVARKMSDLEFKNIDAQIKAHEDYIGPTEAWLAGEEGTTHQEAESYRQAVADSKEQLEELKKQRAEKQIGEARKRVERNPTDLQLRFELGERRALFRAQGHVGHGGVAIQSRGQRNGGHGPDEKRYALRPRPHLRKDGQEGRLSPVHERHHGDRLRLQGCGPARGEHLRRIAILSSSASSS